MIAVKLEPAWQAFESEGKGNAGTREGDGRRGTPSEIIIIIIIIFLIKMYRTYFIDNILTIKILFTINSLNNNI